MQNFCVIINNYFKWHFGVSCAGVCRCMCVCFCMYGWMHVCIYMIEYMCNFKCKIFYIDCSSGIYLHYVKYWEKYL